MTIKRTSKRIFLNQETYTSGMIQRSKAEGATPIYSPMGPRAMRGNEVCEDKSVGRALYLSIMHLTATKRVLRYLAATVSKGLLYPSAADPKSHLHGYTDSDWAGRTSTRKSVGGYIFIDGGPIS